MKEQREIAARAMVSTLSTPRVESLKFHVNSYVGREGEPLLSWLVEVDAAITARRIVDPLSKVAFCHVMSWQTSKKLGNEFKSRAEFLDLQQGKHDVHAYAQRARYLVSNIVTNPIDEATKVFTFMKGLRDGPVKTYLFREYQMDCGASNNFVGLQTLARFDFEEVELPRSLFEVRLATDVIVRTEKRVVRVRFSYREKKYVDELIVLDLDDKFDMVLGMPCKPRHYPVIDWAKRTIVCLAGRHSTGDNRRDPECLDENGYWSTVSEGRAREPSDASVGVDFTRVARDLHDGRVEQICILSDVERKKSEAEELKQLVTEGAVALSAKSKKERFDEQSWDSLKSSPLYEVLREYKDVLPDDIPAELPQDKGVQHEIDLVPGTKYFVTRQWPLPREQVKAIDDFFESRRKAGQVRESKSPHSAPTYCVKTAQGGWRIVHAYNKMNGATVPTQTLIPRKDVIIDSMALSTTFSDLDLRDGFYQILMRESDIPLTAVSTPSGMLWEWLVMPQELKNALATFNRCVTHLLRPVRDFAPSYFDDVFIHSRAVNGKSEVAMHKRHLRKLFALMRKHKLYANLKKCIFGASEIPVLGCLVGKYGVRPDPGKVRVINEWPTPSNVKELRQFLGLATYLCNQAGLD
ncbi:unnamed protein product [Phytophthora fragariaefolia]|uniref:Unnamed protein product n=1 Tax=Phytophthora fragariaefolia TaxID=1490495 RepID=A0A9W7CW81_9STRA|nr:unnamed protein product [Phytophthora fragariaefolia]